MITLPFQRKRKEKLRPSRIKKRESSEKPLKVVKRELKGKQREKPKKELGKSVIAFSTLKEPVISEKATGLEEKYKYIFKVFPKTNKKNIKRAIEEIYKVQVEKVNIIKIRGKKRRVGKIEGVKPGYKKAIVTLKEGEKIETASR